MTRRSVSGKIIRSSVLSVWVKMLWYWEVATIGGCTLPGTFHGWRRRGGHPEGHGLGRAAVVLSDLQRNLPDFINFGDAARRPNPHGPRGERTSTGMGGSTDEDHEPAGTRPLSQLLHLPLLALFLAVNLSVTGNVRGRQASCSRPALRSRTQLRSGPSGPGECRSSTRPGWPLETSLPVAAAITEGRRGSNWDRGQHEPIEMIP